MAFVYVLGCVVLASVLVFAKERGCKKKREVTTAEDTCVKNIKDVEEKVCWYENGVKKWGALCMAQGMQIFDVSGNLIFDLANCTTYILGTGQTGTSNGSISDPNITARTWVVVLSCPADGQIPYFSAEQGKISWQFLGGQLAPSAKNVTFMYGAY